MTCSLPHRTSRFRRKSGEDGRAAHAGRRWLAPALLTLSLSAHAEFEGLEAFADMSLEELANVRITSVSKKSELLSDAPASVFVITGDDIRRAGAATLPEALRLAPNLQVARLDARNYAISARGLNSAFANKLLVLIDGRIVYSPLFSGVFWDAQDVVLEDVLRIEVISGPGATLWGANAVNGVINVITRPAIDTQGMLAAVGASRADRQATVRYGGKSSGDAPYRIYARHLDADDTRRADGGDTQTGWRRSQAGFRSDWSDRGRGLTLQGDAYDGSLRQAGRADIGISGANLSARMNQTIADGSDMSLLAYWDYTHRNQPGAFVENLHTLNVDLQHTLNRAGMHALVWGAGYRLALDRLDNGSASAFLPASSNLRWGSLFVQDEMTVARDLRLTGGLRLEHNSYTGVEVLPTVRLAWHGAGTGLAWGSLSRSARVPSRIDRDFYSPSQPVMVNGTPRHTRIAGGPDFVSEVARVLEIGYRGKPAAALSYSVTAFHSVYDRLRTLESSPDGTSASFANRANGRAQGIETWATLQARPGWRLSAGWVVQRVRTQLEPGSTDASAGTRLENNDPSHYWTLRSSHDLSPDKELDIALRGVGALRMPATPSHVDLGLRLGWRIRRDLELSIVGQNLLDAGHPEFGAPANRSEIERSVFVKLLWRR